MSFTIYALRLRGTIEARYIGQTAHTTDHRLMTHLATAKGMPIPDPRSVWLIENEGEIECVVLGTAETREEARRLELEIIKLFVAMGHRLLNRHGVPAECRIEDSPEMAERRARHMGLWTWSDPAARQAA